MGRRCSRILAISTSLLMGIVGMSGVAPTARAGTTSVDCDSADLQDAIDAATPGDRLVLQGRCRGNFVIEKDLTLKGPAILDGGWAGTTLAVRHAGPDTRPNVTVIDLVITGGEGPDPEWGEAVGGVYNDGRLVLRGATSVRANRGRGIFNEAILIMRGTSEVRGNRGGGIYNPWGSITMSGTSSVRGNIVQGEHGWGGGINNVEGGGVVMHHRSTVRGNQAAWGGGIAGVWAGVEMNDSSTVAGNRASIGGGGIFLGYGGVVLQNSASVRGNVAGRIGGGIDNDGYGLVVVRGSASVLRNEALYGGGISSYGGELVLAQRAAVTHNAARREGGGVWSSDCWEGSLSVRGSSNISDNTVGTKNRPGSGGGVYLMSSSDSDDPCGVATELRSGRIVRNQALGGGSGGGVFGPIGSRGDDMVIRRNIPNNCDPPC
jgi:hypothetical protein